MILGVALVVLGPNRLPEAVRTAGKVMGELRRITGGFQQELRNALDDREPTDVDDEVVDDELDEDELDDELDQDDADHVETAGR